MGEVQTYGIPLVGLASPRNTESQMRYRGGALNFATKALNYFTLMNQKSPIGMRWYMLNTASISDNARKFIEDGIVAHFVFPPFLTADLGSVLGNCQRAV